MPALKFQELIQKLRQISTGKKPLLGMFEFSEE